MVDRFTAGVLWWVATAFASAAGLALALGDGHQVAAGPGLTLISQRSYDFIMDVSILSMAVAAALIATLQGFLQWLVMRRRIAGAGAWVPATAVGVMIGVMAGPPSAGFVLGLLQCLSVIFRVRRAFLAMLWIPVSGLAWMAGARVQARFPAAQDLVRDDYTSMLGWSVGWAAYALVTAVAFVVVLAWDEAPTALAARSRARPRAASEPRRASSPAPTSDTYLQGPRFLAAWLLVGAAEPLLAVLWGPQGSLAGLVIAALAQGYILQRAFGVSMLWAWGPVTIVAHLLAVAFGIFTAETTALLATLVRGTTIGLAQWMVLQPARSRAWLWIPTAVTSIAVPSLFASFTRVPSWVGDLVAVVLGGMVLMALLRDQPPETAVGENGR